MYYTKSTTQQIVDGRIELSSVVNLWEGVDWIDLVQDRDKARDVVNSTMKLKVPYNAGNLND
jgi:hypothetical protein